MSIKKIAIYARVSTEEQNTDLQLQELTEYTNYHKLIVTGEYVDVMSGARDDRPALTNLLSDAEKGLFDAIIVWKIDRLGRSAIHLLNILTKLQEMNIAFISKRESIDTSTPFGKMVFTMLAAIAEFERSIISERVKAGLQARKNNGFKLGPNYKSLDTTTIKELHNNGLSLREIARSLQVSHVTIRNKLKENYNEHSIQY